MWNMDSGSLSAGVTIIVGLIDWKAILNKCLGDAAANMAKVGRTHFMRHLQPDDRQKVARRAIVLFSEEFLKELDDKSPLSCAISGYQDELRILLESASPDIIGCFRPEIQSVDLGPVSDIWNGLTLTPLPEGFDWRFLAQNYARAIRRQVREDPAMRDQLAIALQEDSHDFEQRFSPGFDLGCYREFLQRKCAILQLSVLHTSAYDRRIALWSVFVAQSARESASGTATLIDDKNARSRRLM